MGTLTSPGHLWALLSVAAAILTCSGFYLPFWVQGRILGRVDAYFNSFRRCNYPRLGPQGVVEIVMQCARYSRWKDIPSGWWQASTVLIILGCVISIIVAVMAVTACCIEYIIHSGTARVACSLQLIAGHCYWTREGAVAGNGIMMVLVLPNMPCIVFYLILERVLVSGGLTVYPLGWNNKEMRDSCGPSVHMYSLGNCKISWSVFLLVAAIVILFACFALSPCITKVNYCYCRS